MREGESGVPHQGSALSPVLFAMVIGRWKNKVKQQCLWTMMFADYVPYSPYAVVGSRWKRVLERRAMIEVRDCQLVGHVQRRDSRYTGKTMMNME